MAAENLKSTTVTNLDATPVIVATSGEGASASMKKMDDLASPTTNFTIYSTYRLSRFPTTAKVKKVQMYQSGIDSAATTAAATLDINVAFSDSTVDGTQPALQGTIPSSIKDGTSYAFVNNTGYSTAYSSSGTGNKLFGATVACLNSGAGQTLDLTFKNSFTPANRLDDLWDVFGFVNSQGVAQDPGGFFDIFVVAAHGSSTVAAGVICIDVDYAV